MTNKDKGKFRRLSKERESRDARRTGEPQGPVLRCKHTEPDGRECRAWIAKLSVDGLRATEYRRGVAVVSQTGKGDPGGKATFGLSCVKCRKLTMWSEPTRRIVIDITDEAL